MSAARRRGSAFGWREVTLVEGALLLAALEERHEQRRSQRRASASISWRSPVVPEPALERERPLRTAEGAGAAPEPVGQRHRPAPRGDAAAGVSSPFSQALMR
jgi:hypothetical protein